MSWKPTMELRFLHNPSMLGRPYTLQQKWVKHVKQLVSSGPIAEPSVVELETGESEWKDVPTVPWRHNDDPE